MINNFCETTVLSATLSFASESNLPTLKKNKATIQLKEKTIQLWVPDQIELQSSYQQQEQTTAFPYWAKLWPAAVALSTFILDNPELIKNKVVLELAAGLGLPSLVASEFASSIIYSDYDSQAVAFIEDNIVLNGIQNMVAAEINWTCLPADLSCDLLLLSDINYDPKEFSVLFELIKTFLEKGITILLSTPQRLAGRDFIEQLLPYTVLNKEVWQEQIPLNILVLKN